MLNKKNSNIQHRIKYKQFNGGKSIQTLLKMNCVKVEKECSLDLYVLVEKLLKSSTNNLLGMMSLFTTLSSFNGAVMVKVREIPSKQKND